MWGLRRDPEPTLVDRLYQQGLVRYGVLGETMSRPWLIGCINKDL